MGTEDWVLIALVVVLAVYLLPYLVGRREVMALSRAEDRFSSELRVLATSAATPDDACPGDGRASIFRRRPEVKAMNRPAVRNVRALRVERELASARRAHEEARAGRRTAASHRAVVASLLLGVTLGALVVAAVSLLPWWVAVVPAALLAVSMGAGRRAAVASARADVRERRRISSLEQELAVLSGASGPVLPVPDGAARLAEPAAAAARVESVADRASGARVSARSAASAGSPAVAERASRIEESVAARSEVSESAQVAEPVIASPAEPVAASVPEAESEADGAAPAVIEPEQPKAVKAPATPPQGWHPVHVPAPTYTLEARAPKRAVPELEEAAAPSAPVPARPTEARAFAPAEVGADEQVFHPIDLDAVLERRRAAGA